MGAQTGEHMGVHSLSGTPSAWVVRFEALFRRHARVLDLACGAGRHSIWLAGQGHEVLAVDRDEAALRALSGVTGIRTERLDLELPVWPLSGRMFDAVVVCNYLYRPHLDALLECVRPGGVLVYETFMRGNERFGKPSNPDFLLRPGELLARLARLDELFSVVAFEQGRTGGARPAVLQRVCALRGEAGDGLLPA